MPGASPSPGPSPGPTVLVADLDGTLLAGDPDSRRQLLHALRRHPTITVVYATGRGLSSVQALLAQDPLLPPPRWIIADVGASVIDATDMRHVTALEEPLRTGWPGHDHVRRALSRFPALVYQHDADQQGRCSYYLAPEHRSPDITAAVDELGCTWTYSADRYFDVLPARSGKGPALRRLMRRLRWPETGVLVAGDSRNDLSLFQIGSHGVVMRNAEPDLLAHVSTDPLVHRPALDGAAAILAALERLGWVKRLKGVVIGYHRPPVHWSEGEWHEPCSPNGILPTLASLLDSGADDLDAVWAAATTDDDAGAAPVPTRLPLALLPVPADRWNGYFHRACKETLWPALTSQDHLIQHDAAWWADYEAFNSAFARHINTHAARNGTVWLHDYNLWLVPGLLKRERPDLAVGLFHHTPFPHPLAFRRLPAAEQLRTSLLQLDWAGFHTSDFADNFRRVLGGSPRIPRIGVHPLGIDRHTVAELARSRVPAAPRDPHALLVLSVERLDYAKAPVQKIDAVAALLEQQPALRGRLRYRLVCPPPAPGIHAYDTTRAHLEHAITELNSRWHTPDWAPIDYLPETLSFPDVIDHYLAADVFWVTSLADGMNLTAQEFLVAQAATEGAGVLVLSRYAGAADYLRGPALLTDPQCADDLVDVLRTALTMTPAQRRANTMRLIRLLTMPPPAEWARTVIAAIRDEPVPVPGGVVSR
ncbi:HAD-IIB family hydrolase [Streptomyces sp. P9(2023)]|uniref:HAD-IIB family hydrolase n=1 Tax=Streptomyces sp. P9(2023) TaxID=3064394 RepID=UPI0028F44DA7|nr:HAD-IIB family hydrolase [Streptomyces sp. P9(2023)]MDT9686990.1 HAD-IIB family hydrolase [Streptomyces sp. P9(2023)]